MRAIRDVALLALLYRHAYTNRWECIDDIATDQEIAPGELGWLSMMVALLPDYDWQVIAKLEEPADTFERVARRLDPLRAEAVLHALPPNGAYPTRAWGEPFRERWGQVRQRMRQFHCEGYTAPSDDLHLVASDAYRRATGGTFSDYLDAYEAAGS